MHQEYKDQFESVKAKILDSLRSYFPVVGRRHQIELNNIWVDDNVGMDDFVKQTEAYEKRGDFTVPIYASLTLKDLSGKVIDKKAKVKLISLPKITGRGTYMLGGNEYQVPYQLRLKPNVYNRVKENGELETVVNIKPVALHVLMNPETGIFTMRFGAQKQVSLYHFLIGLGLTDAELANKWGNEVVGRNKTARGNPMAEVHKFFDMAYKKAPENDQQAVDGCIAYLAEKKLDPESTKLTLGQSHSALSLSVLADSAKKLIDLNKGVSKPDERDAVHFKHIVHVEDFLSERLDNEKKKLLFKIKQRIDSKENISEILKADLFNAPIHGFFTNSSSVNMANMLNPMAAFAEGNKVTIMGEGGISEENAITNEARAVHPSQLGFIDPIHTPEGSSIGVVNQLSLMAKKRGNDIVTSMIDTKTNNPTWVTPIQASQGVVAFSDQYEFKHGKYVARYPMVKASVRNNLSKIEPSKVDFIMLSDKQIFSAPSNMTPFLNHISGNRSMMSGKHMEQALPLTFREAPLVQSKSLGNSTFEQGFGARTNVFAKIPGVITKVTKDHITVEDKDGNEDVVSIYNKFVHPSDKVFMHHDAKVAVGDKVKAGQLLAESNYSKDNTYAVGTNLHVAFTPYKGYTFEDGVVISEAAAKKLTSAHVYREVVDIDTNSILDKKKFISYYPTALSGENATKLGEDGVILEGKTVKPGEVLVAHLHKEDYTKEDVLVAQFNKKFLHAYKNRSCSWEEDYEGKIIKVIRRPRGIEVQVETSEPARVGDKISAREGNKGIVTHIIPENETPRTEGGQPIDLFMNPHSVVGRINPAQILEIQAGKIAKKTGQPYIVDNFSGTNYIEKIEGELKKHGLTEKEKIVNSDGTTIDSPIAVGQMHILKLNHPVRKKFQARETNSYTIDMQPTSGGGEGGRKMDQLSIYSMLAHGSVNNLRESSTYKGEKNEEFWRDYQAGLPLPKPRVPFVFDKFQALLKSSGIHSEKDGDQFKFHPITDEQVKKMSGGEISEPEFIQGKNLNEIKGGLFDPAVTGGREGNRWGHIVLAEPMANPVFEKPILNILGMKQAEYDAIISGQKHIDRLGHPTEGKGKTGGEAIKFLLSKINVEAELPKLIEAARTLTGSDLNRVNSKIRYFKALKENKLDPTVYVSHNVPVLPPRFRPITADMTGRLNIAPANPLYRDFMLLNNQLKTAKENGLPDAQMVELRKNINDAYAGLVGTNKSLTDSGAKEQPGFLQLIAGTKPKEGFFQSKMIAKRQDYSGTSTVIPEPSYGLDEIGLPADMAWSIYKPHVVRRLRQLGYSPNDAISVVESRSDLARKILDQEVDSRPVIMNRAPSLHKFSMLSFKPRVVSGRAIRTNPLIVAGYGMDYDGDTVGLHVPVSENARLEALKMLPSSNLYNPQNYDIIHKPQSENVTGLYMMTNPARSTKHSYSTAAQAIADYTNHKVKINDGVTFDGKKTTIGLIMINEVLPVKYRDYGSPITGKSMVALLARISKEDPSLYPEIASKLKDFGTEAIDKLGLTLGIADLKTNYSKRDKIIAQANKDLASHGLASVLPHLEELNKMNRTELRDSNSSLATILDSGGSGKSDAVRQMTSTPFMFTDHNNKPIPLIIGKSFTEGLDSADYFSTLSGSRKGMVDRSLSTSVPGEFTKEVINTSIGCIMRDPDCHTHRGIEASVADKINVIGRYTVDGKLVDNEMLKHHKGATIKVRSPLTCESQNPPCAKCFGHDETGKLPAMGTYLGAIAAQSITEPSTQLVLRKFHTGGVVSKSYFEPDSMHRGFERVQQVLNLPKIVKDKAMLSNHEGKVSSVLPAPQGGWNIVVGAENHYVPGTLQVSVKTGQHVAKGERLSTGVIKPQELSDLKSHLHAKEYMVNELDKAYREEGRIVRRPLFETIVSSLTNRAEIRDPGRTTEYAPGDVVSINKIEAMNRDGAKITSIPIFTGMNQAPHHDEDFIGKLNFNRIKESISEGAAMGYKAQLSHPITGLAYGAEFGTKKAEVNFANLLAKKHFADSIKEAAHLVVTPNEQRD